MGLFSARAIAVIALSSVFTPSAALAQEEKVTFKPSFAQDGLQWWVQELTVTDDLHETLQGRTTITHFYEREFTLEVDEIDDRGATLTLQVRRLVNEVTLNGGQAFFLDSSHPTAADPDGERVRGQSLALRELLQAPATVRVDTNGAVQSVSGLEKLDALFADPALGIEFLAEQLGAPWFAAVAEDIFRVDPAPVPHGVGELWERRIEGEEGETLFRMRLDELTEEHAIVTGAARRDFSVVKALIEEADADEIGQRITFTIRWSLAQGRVLEYTTEQIMDVSLIAPGVDAIQSNTVRIALRRVQ